jgi:Kef-type K+ transport system membrane component KefB
MNNIEVMICLVLLFMAVPDLCRKMGRPALAFPAFVLFGILLGPLVTPGVGTMLQQAGQVGFLLLLFEVGLEIDLPKVRELVRPLRFAVIWSVVQYPVVLGLGRWVGLSWMETLVAGAALTACSVGMAHGAWKHYPGLGRGAGQFTLHVMVGLEVMAIVLLAVETTALDRGLDWIALLRVTGIGVTVVMIARFGGSLTRVFQGVLERTTHWRVHFLVLLVLAVCALGQRLGLDAAKTAFFLGLFMSQATHEGRGLEEYMAPVSRRFLIPIFFVALGLMIPWKMFVNPVVLWALLTAGVLLGVREVMHRRGFNTASDSRAFLLLCPNLTIVALAARAMMEHGSDPRFPAWLLLTGLFMTIPAILLLPLGRTEFVAPDEPVPTSAMETVEVSVPTGEASVATHPQT